MNGSTSAELNEYGPFYIQPVIPGALSNDLTLVNRAIVPMSYQPELAPSVGDNFGLGDIIY